MGKALSYLDVKRQSEQVFGQFGKSKWIPFAKENAEMGGLDANSLANVGVGKTLVCAAMGESTEAAIETLKKYRDRFDLVVNDKLFGYFMDHGLRPDYVFVCDCNIPYRWMEKHREQTEGVKLIATAYANTVWTKMWKGPKYFYVNVDAIESEKVFLPIMGNGIRTVPASSNVSNAMISFFLGADNDGPRNFAGYEQYVLVGYDYSWRPHAGAAGVKTGKYYAFEDPMPKRFYMNHRTMLDANGDVVQTSENLFFSSRWLMSYVRTFRLPVINCSERGILEIPGSTLEKVLSGLVGARREIEQVQRNFEVMEQSHRAFVAARASFDKSREVLYNGRR